MISRKATSSNRQIPKLRVSKCLTLPLIYPSPFIPPPHFHHEPVPHRLLQLKQSGGLSRTGDVHLKSKLAYRRVQPSRLVP